MRETEVRVSFQPSGRTVYVLPGTRLMEAAAGAGIVVNQPCGGEGVCGKCRVLVAQGACAATDQEARIFTAKELADGWRLACQTTVCSPAIVEIPASSTLDAHQQILTQTNQTTPRTIDPPVRKRYVELSSPGRGNDAPDLVRLQEALGPFRVDISLLRVLPTTLREQKFRGTAVLADGELLDFEPDNTEQQILAVALDLGTTTLVAALLDMVSGEELAVASRQNPQTRFGDDVLSRIVYARRGPEGLSELHETIFEAIDAMIGELVEQAGVARQRIYVLSVAGNPTMQQLFCRIDPRWLGEVPFVSATGPGLHVPVAKLGVALHPRAIAYVFPVIGGFVGGDAVAGTLATQLTEQGRPTLLVDIGTNGEIVLWTGEKLLAASTAAGPAFEGARISHGMRGSSGAIEKVVVDGRLRINVIGDTPPVGICGSGLIDLAAELLRHGVICSTGRIQTPDQLADTVPDDLRRRIVVDDNNQLAFLVADESETGTGKPIFLAQRDVRELQLAAGAVRAGTLLLLQRAGLEPDDLEAVLIAGGFGNFVRRKNAQRIGLLPAGIPRTRIRFQGNTSLAGARLAATSCAARDKAERLAREAEHVDLSTDPAFQEAFAEAMVFPEAM